MGIKKRMWGFRATGSSRTCRGPLREVINIELSSTKGGGIKWTLRLECGHTATRYAASLLYKGLKPIKYAPKRCRCIVCGFAQMESHISDWIDALMEAFPGALTTAPNDQSTDVHWFAWSWFLDITSPLAAKLA